MPGALLLRCSLTVLMFFSLLDLHTEAVQAALAKYKERKMPMPSKRRSVLVQSSVEACTPPGETSVPLALFAMGQVYPVHTQVYAHAGLFTCAPMSIGV